MNRRTWLIFASVQTIGEVCSWTWPHISSAFGPPLWVGALILLLPGNLLSGWLIQRLLWTSSLTLFQLRLIQMVVEIVINVGVWQLIALLRIPMKSRQRESEQ